MQSDQTTRVLVSGLGWSGSSVINCLLQEYDNVELVPGSRLKIAPAGYKKLGEFNFFRMIGGIGDMCSPGPCDGVAMPAARLSKVSPKGIKSRVTRPVKAALHARVKSIEELRLVLYTDGILSRINETVAELEAALSKTAVLEDRVEHARNWLAQVVDVVSKPGTQAVVFDQALHLGAHAGIWQRVFQPAKLIIVHRDPRDQLVEQYRYGGFLKRFNGDLRQVYGHDMHAAIRARVDGLKARMRAVDEVAADSPGGEVLILRFEDLVLQYDDSKRRVEELLNLDASLHRRPQAYFDPGWSKGNIGIHQTFKIPGMTDAIMSELMSWYETH